MKTLAVAEAARASPGLQETVLQKLVVTVVTVYNLALAEAQHIMLVEVVAVFIQLVLLVPVVLVVVEMAVAVEVPAPVLLEPQISEEAAVVERPVMAREVMVVRVS
jgi:hypothetical protein